MNPILLGVFLGSGAYFGLVAAAWFWPFPERESRAPLRDLRAVYSEAPTMIASEARKARGIQ